MFNRFSSAKIPLSSDSVFVGNPLVQAIGWENIQVDGGRAQVYLGVRCSAIVEEMQMFGKVLVIARNPRAVLGSIGLYPEVHVPLCHHRAVSVDGRLLFDFACWSHAFVTIEVQPAGWLYAIEFVDDFGDTIHKICLTPESNFEPFVDWVELHQSREPFRARWGRRASFMQDHSLEAIAGDIVSLKPEAVRCFLDEVLAQKRVLKVGVASLGLAAAQEFIPQCLQENGAWIFLNSEACGLHLETGGIADAFLHRPACATTGEPAWILRACDVDGGLICSFAPARVADVADWNTFLQQACAPHRITTKQS